MAVTKDSFLVRFPEFATVGGSAENASAIVTDELAFNDELVHKVEFGKFRDRALSLLTAHRLALRYQANESGMNPQNMPGIMSQQSGNVSGVSAMSTVSAMVSGDRAFTADMSRTNYGLEFLSLLDLVICPAI
jgi:hypothetical protein